MIKNQKNIKDICVFQIFFVTLQPNWHVVCQGARENKQKSERKQAEKREKADKRVR